MKSLETRLGMLDASVRHDWKSDHHFRSAWPDLLKQVRSLSHWRAQVAHFAVMHRSTNGVSREYSLTPFYTSTGMLTNKSSDNLGIRKLVDGRVAFSRLKDRIRTFTRYQWIVRGTSVPGLQTGADPLLLLNLTEE